MRVMLATLALNEMEWLPSLFRQHRNWPGLCGWVFVESADKVYAETNPELVTSQGLSVDGTTDFLEGVSSHFVAGGSHIQHLRHGFTSHASDPAQGKCEARNRYLEVADQLEPDAVIVLDADEFYSRNDQRRINEMIAESIRMHEEVDAFMFRQRHVWRPASVASDPLFLQEVQGGYWRTPHTRVWRWHKGMRYNRNHNWPEVGEAGRYLTTNMLRADKLQGSPECIHMGYASKIESRVAKHRYYEARGEGSEPGATGSRRRMYVECRRAYEAWQPGESLPHGAKVVDYGGYVPEVFQPRLPK